MSIRRSSMSTPWGPSDHEQFLSPDNDVVQVSTCSHGGIGVRIERPMPVALRAIGDRAGEWTWFEEDCAACAPIIAFPDLFPPHYLEGAEQTLRDTFPMNWELHYGRKLKPGESRTLDQLAFEEATKHNFLPRSATGDWAYNVPQGFVYVVGERKTDKATKGFLLPKDEYTSPSRLILDSYPEWEPDTSLPYSKPREAASAA
jgi:uncharacterized protein DUF7007